MAELVQGQSAPVGMKAEGFVDALHRVRQVRARPAGGSPGARGGARPGPRRRRGRAWGREAAWADASAGIGRSLGFLQPGGASRCGASARPRPSLSGGSPRCLQPLRKGLLGMPGPIAPRAGAGPAARPAWGCEV